MYTRRPIFTCAFLFAGLGITGCIDEDFDEHELDLELVASPDEADEPAVGIADELASENGATPYNGYPVVECSSYNVIGVLDDARGANCSLNESLPSGWVWHTMFEDFTPDLAGWTEPLPHSLSRYCIFEYVGPGEPNPETYSQLFAMIDLYPHMSIDSAAQDCRGHRLLGDGLNDSSVLSELANAFHDAIDWIPGGVLAPTTGNRSFAEVAIIDTLSQAAHDDPMLDPVNSHGEFMGDIVSEIACADSDPHCKDAIRFHVAMPREEHELADWYAGGNFGTMGDLAMSIVGAVGQWRQKRLNDPGAPQRLVISASLGWVPEAPYNTDPNRGPVRALEAALNYAACNGAIVLAAAGNTTDSACGSNELDPLAPATYELVEAPDEHWCAEQGFIPIDDATFPVFGSARPLVYAVGGIDGFDRPIPNARPKGMPALAAYASNATVATGNGFTTPLTGTSVSTAVVAGIASLIWSYDPKRTPDEIMHIIADSGYETELGSNFDFSGSLPRVRRASVCAALDYACHNLPAGHCPQLACNTAPPPPDGHLEDYFHAVENALTDPNNLVTHLESDPGVAPVCVTPTWDEQIEPQPEHPLCPACGLDSPPPPDPSDNDVLSLSVAAGYKGSIVAIKLVAYNANGTATAYALSDKAVGSVNDPTVAVTQVYLDAPGTVAASLSFMLVNGSIQDGPIPVRNY